MIIDDGTIVWIGDRIASRAFLADVDHEVDLGDVFIAPAFVDAHVHLSATGFAMTSVDLSLATSAEEAFALVEPHHAKNPKGIFLAHGWDDTHWTDSSEWNTANLSRILGDRTAYLTRIDVHSALVSADILNNISSDIAGYAQSGVVRQSAHHVARLAIFDLLTDGEINSAINRALQRAAENGIVAVHECAGPDISGQRDFAHVMALSDSPDKPVIHGHWADRDLSTVAKLKAHGAAGDLCVDGSIGSRTAYLSQPYADVPASEVNSCGANYLSSDDIANQLIACTNARVQTGFHVIGDQAMQVTVDGILRAIEVCGRDAIRSLRHRIEHAELVDASQLQVLHDAGFTLSMQPVFEELWGQEHGMYESRLGPERVATMNNYGAALKGGILLAFGSDSPVTPMDPWRAIRAATYHRQVTARISLRSAFAAHTKGGWRAALRDEAGTLSVGAPAHFAVWQVQTYLTQEPTGQGWSTDPRSGTPPLPDLANGLPTCVLTVRDGLALFDREEVWPNA